MGDSLGGVQRSLDIFSFCSHCLLPLTASFGNNGKGWLLWNEKCFNYCGYNVKMNSTVAKQRTVKKMLVRLLVMMVVVVSFLMKQKNPVWSLKIHNSLNSNKNSQDTLKTFLRTFLNFRETFASYNTSEN